MEERELLLYQLGELIKDPPVVIDYYGWLNDVDRSMKAIKKVDREAYDRLIDLVSELQRRAGDMIKDLDDEEIPSTIARDHSHYFEEASFITSEINSLKNV